MRTAPLSLAALTALVMTDLHANQTGSSVITLGEIKVSQAAGTALRTENVLTSVDVLGGDQVEDKNVMNSWQLLGQMPGIQLTETGQGAESGKATFRAFNGEGYINGIKMLIDGIPSNVNSGNQRFVDMVFPLDISYIEVVRGTNDPRYGLHNIGGNINYVTRQGGNYIDSRVTYGSFDTREVQLAIGHEEGNFAQNYILAKQDSDGFRDNSNSNKYALGGKWFVTDDAQTLRVGLIARLYHHQAEESGFLTRDELRASRTQSPAKNANDGDDRDMKQLSLHMDWQLSDQLSMSNKLYYNSYNDDRTITFTDYPLGNAPRQRRMWDEQQTGLLSTLTWRANDLLTLDGGINVEEQDNTYRRQRYSFGVPTDFDAAPARIQDDDHYTLRNLGGYVQAIIQPIESLKIIPAMRVDKFDGNTTTLGGQKASLQDYGWIQQPKLSVVYSVSESVDVYANWGRTFQVGSGAAAYKVPPRNEDLQPSINEGWETGIKFTPASWVDGRVAYWRQDATGEVSRRLNDPSGESDNVGETRRWGYDLQVNLHPDERTEVWASYSWQYSKILEPSSALPQSKGKEIDHVPHHLWNTGISYQATQALQLTAWMNGQTNYYLERENTQGTYGGYVLMNIGATYTFTETLSVDLQLKNLTDRYYEYAWYDPDGAKDSLHSPGDGRALYAGLTVDF